MDLNPPSASMGGRAVLVLPWGTGRSRPHGGRADLVLMEDEICSRPSRPPWEDELFSSSHGGRAILCCVKGGILNSQCYICWMSSVKIFGNFCSAEKVKSLKLSMSWAGPEDIYLSTSLASYLDKKLLVLLRDGRKLVGILRSFDQFGTL
ncbi:uncharacterized protein LOC126678295 [Mercurialis annua]|uniref:uncharacterized protein LOC126678295 n=1 Tax=Mercurialis annua TaxID=3986 RepID=UPI00216048CB|nr:uncharacterized protein LOC126678295 [Mercurialis annua]